MRRGNICNTLRKGPRNYSQGSFKVLGEELSQYEGLGQLKNPVKSSGTVLKIFLSQGSDEEWCLLGCYAMWLL
jgi:hypothetical protein